MLPPLSRCSGWAYSLPVSPSRVSLPTTTLTWATYLATFESLDFGHGSAYAYIVTLVTLGLSVIYFRILYGRGEFEA
jgi:ABC-type sugar transport system permease subunit